MAAQHTSKYRAFHILNQEKEGEPYLKRGYTCGKNMG